ncbi:hypothetical protein FSP39_012716 [Pinctada imbricata]|uniref:AB hydrolase-1 domain-containing protein n=1 Tax=Pinctada imbricata TaxID=66713 RepID=A0AA88YIW0_PINIB|nr:hypothetical protein FSP39_012716 [Pinctada imbricata]
METVVIICLSLFYSTIMLLTTLLNPVRLVRGFFNRKKRDVIPKCLNDPTLGTHGYARLEDVRIHYVANGGEQKPLMLFVHGFPEFWYSWRFQLREFSKDYRVVAMDMRGYSDSDKPKGMSNYAIDKIATDVKQLISSLGYKDCVLVGHDWGGIIVYSVATLYPEVVKKLIVLNAPHPGAFHKYLRSSWKQFFQSWYMFLFQMPFLPEFILEHDDLSMFDAMMRKKQIKTITPDDVEAYKYAFSRPGGGLNQPINYYRALFRQSPEKARLLMKKINVPTLVVWGKKDHALRSQLAENAREFFPNLTVKYVENATHWVQLDEPEETNKHIQQFLDKSS